MTAAATAIERLAPGFGAAETDESLAVRASTGSREAFTELVGRYDRRVFNFLRRRCRSEDEAAECTQATLAAAWGSIGRYSPRWRFSTWLYTIASRQAIQRLRERSARRAESDAAAIGAVVAPSRGVDAAVLAAETSANLWSIVQRRLNAEQRGLLWLRYVEDCSIAEMARILNRSAVTVRVLLFRARQALKKHLEAEADHED